jgi:hypothetical protein
MGTDKTEQAKLQRIGYFEIEKTCLSVSMRLMDDFPGIKLDRVKNDGYNPGFSVDKYPFMLILKSGAKLEDCKKVMADHYAKFANNKVYKNKYSVADAYYKNYSSIRRY